MGDFSKKVAKFSEILQDGKSEYKSAIEANVLELRRRFDSLNEGTSLHSGIDEDIMDGLRISCLPLSDIRKELQEEKGKLEKELKDREGSMGEKIGKLRAKIAKKEEKLRELKEEKSQNAKRRSKKIDFDDYKERGIEKEIEDLKENLERQKERLKGDDRAKLEERKTKVENLLTELPDNDWESEEDERIKRQRIIQDWLLIKDDSSKSFDQLKWLESLGEHVATFMLATVDSSRFYGEELVLEQPKFDVLDVATRYIDRTESQEREKANFSVRAKVEEAIKDVRERENELQKKESLAEEEVTENFLAYYVQKFTDERWTSEVTATSLNTIGSHINSISEGLFNIKGNLVSRDIRKVLTELSKEGIEDLAKKEVKEGKAKGKGLSLQQIQEGVAKKLARRSLKGIENEQTRRELANYIGRQVAVSVGSSKMIRFGDLDGDSRYLQIREAPKFDKLEFMFIFKDYMDPEKLQDYLNQLSPEEQMRYEELRWEHLDKEVEGAALVELPESPPADLAAAVPLPQSQLANAIPQPSMSSEETFELSALEASELSALETSSPDDFPDSFDFDWTNENYPKEHKTFTFALLRNAAAIESEKRGTLVSVRALCAEWKLEWDEGTKRFKNETADLSKKLYDVFKNSITQEEAGDYMEADQFTTALECVLAYGIPNDPVLIVGEARVYERGELSTWIEREKKDNGSCRHPVYQHEFNSSTVESPSWYNKDTGIIDVNGLLSKTWGAKVEETAVDVVSVDDFPEFLDRDWADENYPEECKTFTFALLRKAAELEELTLREVCVDMGLKWDKAKNKLQELDDDGSNDLLAKLHDIFEKWCGLKKNDTMQKDAFQKALGHNFFTFSSDIPADPVFIDLPDNPLSEQLFERTELNKSNENMGSRRIRGQREYKHPIVPGLSFFEHQCYTPPWYDKESGEIDISGLLNKKWSTSLKDLEERKKNLLEEKRAAEEQQKLQEMKLELNTIVKEYREEVKGRSTGSRGVAFLFASMQDAAREKEQIPALEKAKYSKNAAEILEKVAGVRDGIKAPSSSLRRKLYDFVKKHESPQEDPRHRTSRPRSR